MYFDHKNNLIKQIKLLKKKYKLIGIKAEFEAEGSRMEEMMRLKDITSSVNLPIILKIEICPLISFLFT